MLTLNAWHEAVPPTIIKLTNINYNMIEKILDIPVSGFWTFIGMTILFNGAAYFAVNGLVKMWVRFMRMLQVRKHGWPPAHLDADGDWKPQPKKADDDKSS